MGKAAVINLRHGRQRILLILQFALYLSTFFETGQAIQLNYDADYLKSNYPDCEASPFAKSHRCHIKSRLRPEQTTFLLCPIPALTPSPPPPPSTHEPYDQYELPHHGNKCSKPEYRDLPDGPTWAQRLNERIMKNDEDLFEPCDIYFRATMPEFPNPAYDQTRTFPGYAQYGWTNVTDESYFNKLSCNSPFSSLPIERPDLVLGLNMTKVQESLTPLKQRRTARGKVDVIHPIECLTTFVPTDNKSWMRPINTLPYVNAERQNKIPVPETCLHCPKTTQFDNDRKTKVKPPKEYRDRFQVMGGEIQPFALKDKTCSLENEAYLHGVVLTSIATDPNFGQNDQEVVDGFPWGSLHKFWPRLVNLRVADIDKDADGKSDCSKGDYYSKILHGDCVFNQRLATDPLEVVNDATLETYMCRGSHHIFASTPDVSKRHQDTYDIPMVALGCAPYHYLMCNQEYNFNQLMESTCICHPLYAVENTNITEDMLEPQCLQMAGVL